MNAALPNHLKNLAELEVGNAFAQLPPAFYTALQPTPLPNPYLVGFFRRMPQP